ncbi:helix-turn-helix domain-containing protein [Sinomonas gamaensis]|uniref:helix-turn-helix domain-containing protein n=1 Tax=Sinomonas gamaensis TaxID=2565624 RepID=UPI0011093C8A
MSMQPANPQTATVIRRAYRLTLDPSPQQAQKLSQWAGAARYAYNHMIAAKQASHGTAGAAIEHCVLLEDALTAALGGAPYQGAHSGGSPW